MSRSFEDGRRWADEGTKLFLDASAGLGDVAFERRTSLPGWTRKHLVAHVAANADALGNLVHWAATGEPTPMYASPAARAAGIGRGPRMRTGELSTWLRQSADELGASMDRLTDDQWASDVVTAQGRTVQASEIPWMRAREICVHSVDLELGVSFADLPADFLTALEVDVVAKRGEVPEVAGLLEERVAWLTGRPHQLVAAPELGAGL